MYDMIYKWGGGGEGFKSLFTPRLKQYPCYTIYTKVQIPCMHTRPSSDFGFNHGIEHLSKYHEIIVGYCT